MTIGFIASTGLDSKMKKNPLDFETWISRVASELASDVDPQAYRERYDEGLSPAEAIAADRAAEFSASPKGP